MKRQILLTFILAQVLSGCTHYYYIPNVQNVPLFTEKNEYRFSGNIGYASRDINYVGDQQTTCIDLQAAYSLTNNIGIMMNYMWAKESYQSDESTVKDYGRGSYFEGAAGYFKPFGQYGIFEIYGGLGTSGQHHQYADSYSNSIEGTSNLSFIKIFLQPSVGLKLSSGDMSFLKPFDVALSTRIYNINYGKIDNSNSEIAEYENFSALSAENHYFIEPALTIRAGWETVKFQFQMGYAIYLNNDYMDFYEKCHASLGLYFILGGNEKK